MFIKMYVTIPLPWESYGISRSSLKVDLSTFIFRDPPGEHAQLLRPMEGGKNPPNLFVVGGVGDLPMVTKKPTTKLGQKSTVVGSILLFRSRMVICFSLRDSTTSVF